jgi:hypothetical protein
VGAGSAHYRLTTRTAKLVSIFVPYPVRKALKAAKKHQIKGLAQTKAQSTKTLSKANLTLVG